jgi:uncharacterized protein YdeI (BOF family)
MNKTKPIIIAAVILLILLGAFAYTKTKSSAPATQKEQAKTQEGSQQTTGSKMEEITGSLADILKMGSAVKCNGNYSGDSGEMNVTVYTSGNKSYSEMTVDTPDQGTFMTYSIYDGDWLYTWGDYGMASKMKVSDIQELSGKAPSDVPTPKDYQGSETEGPQAFEQQFDYSCTPWVVESSKFTPPSDVEFTDIGQMMKNMNDALDSGDTEQMKQMMEQFGQ